jgi:hypothetical protein
LNDDLDDVSQVLITGAGGQQIVSLTRAADAWIVSEADGYVAERSTVNALLIALAEARIVEEKTANPELHSRLGVEDIDDADATGVEVAVVTDDGARYDAVFGYEYNGGQVYARLADSDRSVLIDRNPEIARDPADWVVSEIIDIASDRVQRVEITQADGERLVIRKNTRSAGNFSVDDIPDGRQLQYAGVANVTASVLTSLELDAVRRAAADQAGPVVSSEFWMFDGLVITVTTTGEGEDAWLSFAARFDVEQALAYATDPDAGADADADADEPGDAGSVVRPSETDASEANEFSARDEAEQIDSRLADWNYRIASYKLSQLTRRVEDLLQPETDE